MAQLYTYPPLDVTTSDPSVGPVGDPIPADAQLVGAEDGSGDLQPLQVDSLGNLKVISVPSGTGDVNLVEVGGAAIALGQALMAASLPVAIASNQSTLPISAASLPLPTGAATSSLQTTGNTSLASIDTSTASIDTKTPALGQALAAASVPVVLTAAQLSTLTPLSTVAATQSGTWDINNISGTISLPTLAATSTKQSDGSQKTQIVDGSGNVIGATSNALDVNIKSAASITVSGTVTANQGTSPWVENLSQVGGASFALGQQLAAASLPVVLTAAQISTLTPLSTVAVTQSTSPWVENLTQVGGSSFALGQQLAAASLPVVLTASQISTLTPLSSVTVTQATGSNLHVVVDSGTITPTASSGRSKANTPVVTDYSSTSVTSAAYVQLVASTSSTINMIEIFDSSGVALYFATGAAASEVNQFVIYPGGNGQVPINIASGTRISVKAVSTSATSGTGIINFYT